MKFKPEMHPRLLQRRMEIGREKIAAMNEEFRSAHPGWDPVAEFVSHYEGKLPRPENYRKKTVAHLRHLLRKIDHYLELCDGQRDRGEIFISEMSSMYGRHRKLVVAEIARRMVKGGRA